MGGAEGRDQPHRYRAREIEEDGLLFELQSSVEFVVQPSVSTGR